MKTSRSWLRLFLCLLCLGGMVAKAEDIDIFTGSTAVNTSLPNVIFVLDNTSNWSRQSQKWPGGLVQGQAEVRAIKTALAPLVGKLNVGIMEYGTQGSSADTDAGYVRFDLQEFTASSQLVLNQTLDDIFNDINGPTEKRSSSNPYGYLPWDLYNYLSGSAHSKNGAGTPSSLADPDAYTTQFSLFESPLGAPDACADTYMIFIGNNANGNIASDDATNTAALKALYEAMGEEAPDALAGDAGGTPLGMPDFDTVLVTGEDVVIPGYTIPGYTIPAQTIPPQNYGPSAACWKSGEQAACTATECVGRQFCSCTAISTPNNVPAGCNTTGNPAKNRTFRWNVASAGGVVPAQVVPDQIVPEQVIPGEVTTEYRPSSGPPDLITGRSYNFDDWAKFLHNYGIPLSVTVDNQTYSERVKVVTFTIDVFNAQSNGDLSAVWFSAANAGGGRYFQAKNEDQIVAAINTSLGDIISVASSFSAVSLPLSTTNRAQVDNQLYIGTFRPSLGKKPRWYGNLKRYQLAMFNGVPRVADANLREAINSQSGVARECAESFWTEDTGNFWEDLGVNPSPLSECNDLDVTNSPWSDMPDGNFVEKGGVAQQIRQGPQGDSRVIYTVDAGGGLRALAASDAAAMGGVDVLDYFRGDAAGADGEVMPASGLRASVHGDVVHSRPLALRHTADSVTLYYGSNDGLFRAVDAETGAERWSMIVPEHFSRLGRLLNNYPLIEYTGATPDPGLSYDPKAYFFDGPTGQIALYDESDALELAYIYPTMRRGGRMVYALDVTDGESAPELLWRVGCPNLDNDTNCTTGYSDIGQTWSTPVGGYAAGYVDVDGNPQLIVAFGGGFDDCLNADVAAFPAAACSSAKGRGIFILDATTGEKLAYLATEAPVITELAPVDIDFDGNLDFIYAADVAGNLYRVNLAEMADADPRAGVTAFAKDDWTIVKIGATDDSTRRFYNAPVVGAVQGVVIVALGSGDRERPLELNYPYLADVQNRFYVLFDEPHKTFISDPNAVLEDDETRTISLDGDTMLAVVPGDVGDAEPDLREYDGWYMDLADRGEQVANAAAIGGGRVFFNTFQPGGLSNGLCTRPLGIGTGYDVSLFGPEYTTGNEITAPGLPIPPIIVTTLIGPGQPDCDGPGCPPPPDVDCEEGGCEKITLCLGCNDLSELTVIEPDAPPVRRRLFFTEDVDRVQ